MTTSKPKQPVSTNKRTSNKVTYNPYPYSPTNPKRNRYPYVKTERKTTSSLDSKKRLHRLQKYKSDSTSTSGHRYGSYNPENKSDFLNEQGKYDGQIETMPKPNQYAPTNGNYKVLFPRDEDGRDKLKLYSAREKVEHQLKEKFPPFVKKHVGLQKAFDKFDVDPEDGLISLSEMKKVLEDLGFESFRVRIFFTVEIEDVAPGAIQFIEEEARKENKEIPGKPDGQVSLEELAAADLE